MQITLERPTVLSKDIFPSSGMALQVVINLYPIMYVLLVLIETW